MNIIFYTTHCPKCLVLERKLKAKDIPFETETNLSEIEKTGIKSVPLLKVNDTIMDFSEALKWVNTYAN